MPSDSTGAIIAKDDVVPPCICTDADYQDVVSVKSGDSFTLKAYLAGNPFPNVSWEKNGLTLSSNKRISIVVSKFFLF